MIQKPGGLDKGFAVFGRYAMTCCADDVQFMGFLCKADDWSQIKSGQYVTVTARMEYKFMAEYGEGRSCILCGGNCTCRETGR